MSRRRPAGIPLGPWPVALAVSVVVGFLVLSHAVFPAVDFLMDRGEQIFRESLTPPR